jgi:dihydrofolate reductase (trimethoprim resistance protein)
MKDLLERCMAILGKALPTSRTVTYQQGCVLLVDLGVAHAKLDTARFQIGDNVRKKTGAAWQGKVVGTYSTNLTPEGYCVESDAHPGSVQIYPAAALEGVK